MNLISHTRFSWIKNNILLIMGWGKKNDEVSSGQFEVISLLHMQAEALSLEVRCHHLQA